MVGAYYLGPTNCRGSRVVVHSLGGGARSDRRLVVSFNYAARDAFDYAVEQYAKKFHADYPPATLLRSGDAGGGYVYALVTPFVAKVIGVDSAEVRS
jgi:hypothetical protein